MKPIRIALLAAMSAALMMMVVPAAQAESCYQPDAMIKGIGTDSFVGDGIYNTNGADQTKLRRARPGQSDTFRIRLQNDACSTDAFTVQGDGAGSRFMARYYWGVDDVTSLVTNGTFATPPLDPGEYTSIRVQITAKNSTSPGDVQRLDITAISQHGGFAAPEAYGCISCFETDTVRAILEVKGTAGNQGGA